VFIHIPKNAGQSISRSLYGYTIHHLKAYQIKSVSPRFFEDAFVFACVRDPVSRFKSAYKYLCDGGRSNSDKQIYERYLRGKSLDEFLEYLMTVDQDDIEYLYHFHTQSSFVSERYDYLSIIVDRVYRLEELECVIRDFKYRSLFPPLRGEFPVENKSNSDSLVLSEDQEATIRELYKIDYVNFY